VLIWLIIIMTTALITLNGLNKYVDLFCSQCPVTFLISVCSIHPTTRMMS